MLWTLVRWRSCYSNCSFAHNNASYATVLGAYDSASVNFSSSNCSANTATKNAPVMILADKARVSLSELLSYL
jgi:hypothetical protein